MRVIITATLITCYIRNILDIRYFCIDALYFFINPGGPIGDQPRCHISCKSNCTRAGYGNRYETKCKVNYERENVMETEIVERCTDIDECQTQQPCGPGTCINTDGSYECICPCGRIGRNCESRFSTLVRPSVPVCLLVITVFCQ